MKKSVGVALCLIFASALLVNAPAWALTAEQEAKLVASDGAVEDWFGCSVAVDGNTAIVGAIWDNDNGSNSGSAYVFTRTGDVWTEQVKLLPASGAAGNEFGSCVAFDGDTVVIGASGSAYVFTRTGDVWTEQAKLLASDGAASDHFGRSVAVDGDTAVIGAHTDDDNGYNSGSAYVFRLIPPDADGDGVDDVVDACLDTAIPESVPTKKLGINRWALVDDDGAFDTAPPPGGGGGPDFTFTVADTGGCSCEQIIEAWDLGQGHTKFGCSTGVMLQWIAYVGDYGLAQVKKESDQSTEGAIQTLTEDAESIPSASTQGTPNNPFPRRQQSMIRERLPRRETDKK